jgi:hypothetical protein
MFARSMSRHPVLVVLALALVGLLSGSNGLQGQKPGAATALVVDVRALGTDGKPVLDLKDDDLALKINGQVRPVRSLELLRFARQPGADQGAPPPASLPPPFATNQFAAMGRDVYFVFEDESISPSNDDPPRQAALRLLEALEPRDRVAVATVPRGGIDVGLTTDRERVRAALAQRLGRAALSETADDSACRTRRTLDGLMSIYGGVWNGPAATVVFFSSGVLPPTVEMTLSNTRLGGTQSLCPVRPEEYQSLAKAARASRANTYVVYLIDGAVTGVLGNNPAGLESVAGVTDGGFYSLSRSNPGLLASIAIETAASYVVTFDAAPSDQQGKALRVDVKTTREGVKLRAPSELVVPDRRGRVGSRSNASSASEMLRVGQPFLDLPLRAVTYASRNAEDDRVKLVVLFETTDPSARLASAVTGAFDGKGSLKAQSTATKDDLGVSPAMSVLAVSPGTYRVRVAATDSTGRGGTVDLDVKANLAPAGTLNLSTLVLGASGGASFGPRLEFRTEPAAIAYLEVYGRPGKADLTVSFELRAADGARVLARTPGTLRSTSFDDLRLAMGELPIATLPPGDYLVSAVASMDGKETARVERTLRKRIEN